MKTRDSRIFDIVFVGVLAAMVYVVTLYPICCEFLS